MTRRRRPPASAAAAGGGDDAAYLARSHHFAGLLRAAAEQREGGGGEGAAPYEAADFPDAPAPDPAMLAGFAGLAAEAAAHQAAAAAPAAAVAAGGACVHPFADQFVDYHHERAGGPWRCTACSGALADAAAVAQWEARQRDARADDAAGCGGALDFGGALPSMRPAAAAGRHAERLRGFGVSVELLVAFTEAHGCWDWPTWRVQAEIIRPACAAARCRYAELPAVLAAGGGGGVGPATVFIRRA
jgi:hypothetical protein